MPPSDQTLSGSGEIDLIAWDGERLAIVEVKTASRTDFGTPESGVDAAKRARVIRAARDYARRADVPWEKVRFDIISIVLSSAPAIEWLRDAF